jgi:hypothetical protein
MRMLDIDMTEKVFTAEFSFRQEKTQKYINVST